MTRNVMYQHVPVGQVGQVGPVCLCLALATKNEVRLSDIRMIRYERVGGGGTRGVAS